MNKKTPGNPVKKISSLRGLSIQQRLPLLVCVLLLTIVVALGIASYIGVKRASLKIASQRLKIATAQLSSILGQTARAAVLSTHSIANEEAVRTYLSTGGATPDSAIVENFLRKLQTDTQAMYVELLDRNYKRVLKTGKQETEIGVNDQSVVEELRLATDSASVGKMYQSGDSLYYPIVATVTENKEITGYVVRWRLVFSTPQGMEQFSRLLGSDAKIYVANSDGSVWSDLMKPIEAPPQNVFDTNRYFSYSHGNTGRVIAASKPIDNTAWTLLVEFPQRTILESARSFAGWILLIGGIITIIGILVGWRMSRNITRPLNKLTIATTAIAAGDYTSSIEVNRKDELGELARSFNAMVVQIKNEQETLEHKVKDRTAQLEEAYKELEAFSYSVSHDLRAPLRAISGYAIMLKEDYAEKLDEEAIRITNTIISNAKMMGQLIDDLIAFSKTGAKGIVMQTVNMRNLAISCADELLKHEPANKYKIEIASLPECKGDPNLLMQVWMNLISNAIKYSSREEKPAIEIGGIENESSFSYFIKDNGVGFDMQYADKLFGVFQRLHSDAVYKGTGIGLALVKRIINKHHGSIRAESAPGKGATFYFEIPKTNLYE